MLGIPGSELLLWFIMGILDKFSLVSTYSKCLFKTLAFSFESEIGSPFITNVEML